MKEEGERGKGRGQKSVKKEELERIKRQRRMIRVKGDKGKVGCGI